MVCTTVFIYTSGLIFVLYERSSCVYMYICVTLWVYIGENCEFVKCIRKQYKDDLFTFRQQIKSKTYSRTCLPTSNNLDPNPNVYI